MGNLLVSVFCSFEDSFMGCTLRAVTLLVRPFFAPSLSDETCGSKTPRSYKWRYETLTIKKCFSIQPNEHIKIKLLFAMEHLSLPLTNSTFGNAINCEVFV